MLTSFLEKKIQEPEIWLELEQQSVSSLESLYEDDSDDDSESSSDDDYNAKKVNFPDRSSRRNQRRKASLRADKEGSSPKLGRQTTGSAPDLRRPFAGEPSKLVGGSNANWDRTPRKTTFPCSSGFVVDTLNGTRSPQPSNRFPNDTPLSSSGPPETGGRLSVTRSSSALLSLHRTSPSNLAGQGRANARWEATPKSRASLSKLSRTSAPDLLALSAPEQGSVNNLSGVRQSAPEQGSVNARWNSTGASPAKPTTSGLRTRYPRVSAPDLLVPRSRTAPERSSGNARWTSSGPRKSLSKVKLDLLSGSSPSGKRPDVTAAHADSAHVKPALTTLKRGSSTESAIRNKSRWSSASGLSSPVDPLGSGSNHSASLNDLVRRSNTGATISPHDSAETVYSFIADHWSTAKQLPRRHPKKKEEAKKKEVSEVQGPDDYESTAVQAAKDIVVLITAAQDNVREEIKTIVATPATLNLCALAQRGPRRMVKGMSDSNLMSAAAAEEEEEPQQRASLPSRFDGPKLPQRRGSVFDTPAAVDGFAHIHDEDCLESDHQSHKEDYDGSCSLKKVPSDTILTVPSRRLSCISEDALSALQRSFAGNSSVDTKTSPKAPFQRQLTGESTLTDTSESEPALQAGPSQRSTMPTSIQAPRHLPARQYDDSHDASAGLGYEHILPDNAARFRCRRCSLEKIKPLRKSSLDMTSPGSNFKQPRRKSSIDMQVFSSFQRMLRKSSMDTTASNDSSCCSLFPQLRKTSLAMSEYSESFEIEPQTTGGNPLTQHNDTACSNMNIPVTNSTRYPRRNSKAMSECSDVSAPETPIKRGPRVSIAMTECSDISMPSIWQNSQLFESFTSDVFSMLAAEISPQSQSEALGNEDDYSNVRDDLERSTPLGLAKPTHSSPSLGKNQSGFGLAMPTRRTSVMVPKDD